VRVADISDQKTACRPTGREVVDTFVAGDHEARRDAMAAEEIVFEAVRAVTFGPAQTFRNLTLIPLMANHAHEADYTILDDALALGSVEIGETSEAGQVPELKVLNRGEKAVLLRDGEELIGAKQNRVLNLGILVPPQSSRTIPVSYVESGRWSRSSAHFASAPRTQYAEGRHARMQQVTDSLLASGSRESDQRAVWASIEKKMSRLGSRSDTAAMSAMYEDLKQSLEEFVSAFHAMDSQAGAVFLVNGRPAGIELFDAPATWKKLSSKLVTGYALDAIDRSSEPTGSRASMTAHAVIDAITSSQVSVFAAIGEGSDVRLTGSDVSGAALVARGRTIHVSACATV
jgi:hypothetical protein